MQFLLHLTFTTVIICVALTSPSWMQSAAAQPQSAPLLLYTGWQCESEFIMMNQTIVSGQCTKASEWMFVFESFIVQLGSADTNEFTMTVYQDEKCSQQYGPVYGGRGPQECVNDGESWSVMIDAPIVAPFIYEDFTPQEASCTNGPSSDRYGIAQGECIMPLHPTPFNQPYTFFVSESGQWNLTYFWSGQQDCTIPTQTMTGQLDQCITRPNGSGPVQITVNPNAIRQLVNQNHYKPRSHQTKAHMDKRHMKN